MAKSKKQQPAKRKYVKRSPKWVLSTKKDMSFPEIKLNLEAIAKPDELDLLRDMLANFESMAEDARYRAYQYLTSKYSRYGTTF